MSSKWIAYHQPCDSCGSSDAVSVNDRGWSTCFSCGRKKKVDNSDETCYNKSVDKAVSRGPVLEQERKYTVQRVAYRGISVNTQKFFNVSQRVNPEGKPYAVEYKLGEDVKLIRLLEQKRFFFEGPGAKAEVFGSKNFAPGSGRAITITEGFDDAMSVYEMMGPYPVIGCRSATSARAECEKVRDYINSFERIYLAMDDDEPGQKAAQEIAKLFDVNKVFHVKLGGGCKDPNDYLTKGKKAEFVKAWWNAKKFLPKGVINTIEDVEKVLNAEEAQAVANFPFPKLDDMTRGIRLGEYLLFTANEGIGKTEVIRAIEYKMLKDTDYNVGIIHLEEGERRSIQGLIGYELNLPVHLPEAMVTTKEQLEAYSKLVKRDGRVHYYTHFGSDDPDTILDVIRYIVGVCHCKFIFLDHITMLVTGYEGEDERKKLDYLSTRLAMMTRELDFTLVLVSHVNDDGKTRGSRNISKVADLVVHLNRDIEASDPLVRNTTSLLVKKNRFGGTTGPGGHLEFDPESYTLSQKREPALVEEESEAF